MCCPCCGYCSPEVKKEEQWAEDDAWREQRVEHRKQIEAMAVTQRAPGWESRLCNSLAAFHVGGFHVYHSWGWYHVAWSSTKSLGAIHPSPGRGAQDNTSDVGSQAGGPMVPPAPAGAGRLISTFWSAYPLDGLFQIRGGPCPARNPPLREIH